jgi:hypothetical protein
VSAFGHTFLDDTGAGSIIDDVPGFLSTLDYMVEHPEEYATRRPVSPAVTASSFAEPVMPMKLPPMPEVSQPLPIRRTVSPAAFASGPASPIWPLEPQPVVERPAPAVVGPAQPALPAPVQLTIIQGQGLGTDRGERSKLRSVPLWEAAMASELRALVAAYDRTDETAHPLLFALLTAKARGLEPAIVASVERELARKRSDLEE